MAVMAEAPIIEETARMFDPRASVRMMRHDILQHGYVLPETRDQVYNEELSYLAEGVDRAARTSFGLKRDEAGGLVYFAKGEWRPYTGMLMTGREVAHREALADPRKQFLAEWADADIYRGFQMQRLKPGERMSWYSPYRRDIEQQYGKDFMRACGLFPERQMGFLYQATCQADGTVLLETQTVDRSDEDAFLAALSPEMQQAGLDAMLDAYDFVLSRKHGGIFYAGRRDNKRGENAWESIREQRDLVEYLLDQLEVYAHSHLDGVELEMTVKKHIYGVWAAFKNRLDGQPAANDRRSVYGFSASSIQQEVLNAFRQFAAEGRVLVGCGGSINVLQGEDGILNASANDVFDAIFGNKGEEAPRLPAIIKCINCKEKVPSKEVVKEKSWCCPKCKYEVDICDGKVLCEGIKKK